MIDVFEGRIAGVGTTSGTRIVIGAWARSPLGAFADVMVEDAAGRRTLLAPDETVADYVAATYHFDDVDVSPLRVSVGPRTWQVQHRRLGLTIALDRRTLLGIALGVVPGPIAASESWARALSPIAARLQHGVRLHGSAGGNRTEWYAACDVRAIATAAGRWDGTPLGALAPLTPPVRFGFSSAPAAPSVTTVRSFVRVPD